jgi:photosystem II stability/assembly factor-like uncharacterized protein
MQRNKLFIILGLASIITISGIAYKYLTSSTETAEKQTLGDDAMSFNRSAREAWNLARLSDPATGEIPADIRRKELAFAANLPHANMFRKSGELWEPLGPHNVGGRTRAIVIDVDDENILLAGGANGGIWRSEDGGQNWTKTTSNTQINAITAIAQDTRAGKTNIWYATTGERLGASASKTGAFFTGNGFLKSTDGGKSWTSLASTARNTPQFDSNFDLGWNILVNHTVTDKDAVFAAIFSGIYRSLDGGDTWNRVLGTGAPEFCDIAITKSGVLYATIEDVGSQRGIWRSDDNGDNWARITPANFPATYDRMVIGLVPQFENQLYILAYTPNAGQKTTNFRGDEEWNSLWKYTYISGDGSGNGGAWEDRSAGIPASTTEFESFNAQGGYNYLVKVHPADTNLVFIGGTSLFRSTDGFKTSNNTKKVGGFALGTRRPDFTFFEGHHPDQHNLIFYKSDPNKAISSHDGGVSLTRNIKKDIVEWESLNQGYVTTQFYTVALNESKAGDNVVIGGLQDNGTLRTDKYDRKNPWNLIFSYDGAFCHVADNGTDYYVAKQQAGLYRVRLDNKGNRVQSARLDPPNLTNDDYEFIHPWCVNPNDDKQIYLPIRSFGGGIIRNTDVTKEPLDNFLDSSRTNTNWDTLSATFGAGRIKAISMSTKPANILFYGTENGAVLKVENAHTGQPTVKNITGSNTVAANINNICVHPEDADKLIVVMSNYNVRSLFYTEDGGDNWVNISGNLEENPNGTGNGPSCRWAAFVETESGDGVLVATSVGLFGTPALNGENTVWIQQSPDGIGNAVCDMIKVRRSDNKVVVATHGAGVYIANLSRSYHLTGLNEDASADKQAVDFNLYPNPAQSELNISITDDAFKTATISIYNINGQKLIEEKSTNSKTKLMVDMLPQGTYLLRVSKANGNSSKLFIKK